MTDPAPRRRVVVVDGVPMSGLASHVADPHAVIVALHGGASSSAYFDCPGHPELSLLRAAATRGFTAIALDRPGYGTSAAYAAEFSDPTRRVAASFGAVAKILGGGGHGAGMFLVGHSAGCELALRMTIARTDVIGVELAGTGMRYCDEATAIINEAMLTRRPAGLRDLLWQPTELYPDEVLTGALSAPGAAYESELTANWPRRDFPAVAAQVRVPVQFSAADHEGVWESSPDALSAICGLFTGSERVVLNHMPDSGHNLSVGKTAGEYHGTVLSFIEECIAGSGRNRDQEEAS